MRSYGIMQGRLTPSNGRGVQFFPFESWKREFEIGASIGVNEIEWIFDYERYDENPLWTGSGIRDLKGVIGQTGVAVRSVCFDYFMRRPFYKLDGTARAAVRLENMEFVKRAVEGVKEIGAGLLEIPMVDGSSIKTAEERGMMMDFLRETLFLADDADILVGCETDMPVGIFRKFLDDVGHERIRANYDSGNSSGLGYDHANELLSLGDYVANVHIKDRMLHGATVALGTGDADFEKVFSSLNDIGYKGSLILQAARGEDGLEEANIKSQLQFVKKCCVKHNLE